MNNTVVLVAAIAAVTVMSVVDSCARAHAAAVPPRQRLARSLSGGRVAAIVTAAPAGARIGVPLAGLREWGEPSERSAGDTCSLSGAVYVCVQSHTALPGWEPPAVPALWRLVRAAGETGVPAWRQPAGAHDAYQAGDRVSFGGKTYESRIANNVWSPDAYPAGWTEIK
ncbi:MAG TPA: hypothetical protein P5026_07920 [Kiritimatiellia bacterium]|nr:hypothetical protein [Kiritimatiellia bacterium]HRU10245.1 hypothetical protein [Thermoanaerobaculia bacterium]